MFYDLIIIGGGPAGITAGIYAARKRLKILFLTKDFVGQVGKTGEVDNWPGVFGVSGIELVKQFEEHLRKFKIEIITGEEAVGVEKQSKGFLVKTGSGARFSAYAVIIATGRKPKLLGASGEKQLQGRGVSYCSVCDAPFFRDKRVAIVGGGNAGFEAGLDLVKYAKKVFIFEKSDKIIADEVLQARAKEAGVEVLTNKIIEKIEGADKVETIIFKDVKTGQSFAQPMQGVFVQIGFAPITEFVHGFVKLNKQGEIKVAQETCATSVKGVFAAGDNNDNGPEQIITAAADGCRAALSAYEFLQNKK